MSRCRQGCAPSEGWKEESLPLLASAGCWHSLFFLGLWQHHSSLYFSLLVPMPLCGCAQGSLLFWLKGLYYMTCSSFPGGTSGEEPACQYRRPKRCRFDPWLKKIPWRRKWHPTPVFLPGESHGQRSLVGYSPWGCKELDMTEAT